jgi:hypothetical protein
MRAIMACSAAALLLTGCCQPSPAPGSDVTTLRKVVAATMTGVEGGALDADSNGLPKIGLNLCTLSQTWNVAQAGTSSTSVSAAVNAGEIPISLGANHGESSTHSEANTIVLTWLDPDCPSAGGGGGGAAPAGAPSGASKPPAAGGGGGGPQFYDPIVFQASDCGATRRADSRTMYLNGKLTKVFLCRKKFGGLDLKLGPQPALAP